MMGRQAGDQSQLFYLFNLEERIPVSHLLRRINPTVTHVLVGLREKLEPFYSELGRPSIDPELMIRMLIVGYCYGIRSERRLCEEVEMHLAYRWFCRLDLDDRVPDHSTFSVNRHGRFRSSDTAYGVGRLLALLWAKGITPHIPVRDFSLRDDGTFSRSDFTFDKDRNRYVCPAGKLLKTTGRILSGYVLRYTASTYDCGPCPLKSGCCPNTPQRIVPRDVNEDARDQARALVGTPEFEKSRDDRKKVEMRFAHLKVHHHFERMRLRGLTGARDEFQLAATVQNLKTIANHLWRPPPNHSAHCPA